jgi:hypothetical protein
MDYGSCKEARRKARRKACTFAEGCACEESHQGRQEVVLKTQTSSKGASTLLHLEEFGDSVSPHEVIARA